MLFIWEVVSYTEMMNNDFHNLLSHSISSFSKEKAN